MNISSSKRQKKNKNNADRCRQVHLSFKDTSAQHRQQLATAGAIQLTMHGAAAPVTLPFFLGYMGI